MGDLGIERHDEMTSFQNILYLLVLPFALGTHRARRHANARKVSKAKQVANYPAEFRVF